MADVKQELADVQTAIQQIEKQVETPVPAAPPAPGKIRLRHPHTGDVKDVDATPAAMIPALGLGYVQVKG